MGLHSLVWHLAPKNTIYVPEEEDIILVTERQKGRVEIEWIF